MFSEENLTSSTESLQLQLIKVLNCNSEHISVLVKGRNTSVFQVNISALSTSLSLLYRESSIFNKLNWSLH